MPLESVAQLYHEGEWLWWLTYPRHHLHARYRADPAKVLHVKKAISMSAFVSTRISTLPNLEHIIENSPKQESNEFSNMALLALIGYQGGESFFGKRRIKYVFYSWWWSRASIQSGNIQEHDWTRIVDSMDPRCY